jgi:hypothetical protein
MNTRNIYRNTREQNTLLPTMRRAVSTPEEKKVRLFLWLPKLAELHIHTGG